MAESSLRLAEGGRSTTLQATTHNHVNRRFDVRVISMSWRLNVPRNIFNDSVEKSGIVGIACHYKAYLTQFNISRPVKRYFFAI